MEKVIEWAYLPWLDQGTSGSVCEIAFAVLMLFALITQLIRRTKLGYDLHVAPFLTMEAYGYALTVNTAMFALFYWYVAIAVGFCFSLAFCCAARGIQKKAYYDEKNGKWGLSPALRQVRGELFADRPVDEQLSYKKQVDASFRKLFAPLYFLITLAVPFAVVLILYLCGAGYLFVPQAL